jgi:DNA-binding NarL/FixJ family response regulator
MEPALFSSSELEIRGHRWRLILADDHKMLREGLRTLLGDSEFEVVAELDDGRSLVTAAAKLRPDLIITDVTMPLLNGLEASKQILQHNPGIKILMLSMHRSASYQIEARNAGIRGYVLKCANWPILREAIRRVLAGQLCFELGVKQLGLRSADLWDGDVRDGPTLTQRQHGVLRMLAEGRGIKEIAGTLGISPRTVEFHKYRIMNALGLHSVPELAVYAVKTGIV